MAKRFVWSTPGEHAYRPEEFRAIRSAARRTFRPALQRIRENTRFLEEWRAGAVGHGTPQWLLGEALDVLARTGNVPQKPLKNGGMRALFRYRAVLGGTGSLHTWRRLYLSRKEAAALGVLIAAELGFNATTICELAVPTVVPDSGPAAGLIYRLSLDKRRRSGRGRFESRNVADMGADSAGPAPPRTPSPPSTPTSKQARVSPGRQPAAPSGQPARPPPSPEPSAPVVRPGTSSTTPDWPSTTTRTSS